MHASRETWLTTAARGPIAGLFKAKGVTIPDAFKRVRVSVGFPLGARTTSAIGQCWYPSASADGMHEVFVSPVIDDASRALDVLAHELCHVAAGSSAQHGTAFKRLAHAVGLTGKMKATTAGPEFTAWAKGALGELGKYPHGALNVARSPRKKQTTRLIKVSCPDCDYTVRVTRSWLDIGLPICPADTIPMEEA